MNLKKIESATEMLLDAIGDNELDESTRLIPNRVARAYREMLDGYYMA